MSLKVVDPNNGYWEEIVGNVKNKTNQTKPNTDRHKPHPQNKDFWKLILNTNHNEIFSVKT